MVNLPTIPLSAIVGVHFILLSWAYLYPWLSECYFLTNLFVLLMGIWSIKDKTSGEPIQCFLFGMGFTVLNDIILLGIHFGPTKTVAGTKSAFQFTAAMAIIHLLIKPISCLFLFKDWQERGSPGYNDIQSEYAQPDYSTPQSRAFAPPPSSAYMPPPSGPYMPPQGGYESKGVRQPPPQTTYNAPTVGP